MRAAAAWSVTAEPSEADLAVLADGVVAFGRALAVGGNARPLACFVRVDGAIVAGGSGRTEFARLFVHYLWVDQRHRGGGLGSAVLARLEDAARERDCDDALLETLNDRVAALYERLGYRAIATIPAFVGPFTRHILVKRLR